jgi:hypothetical protein
MRSVIYMFISIGLLLTHFGCAIPTKPYARPHDLPPPPSEDAMKQLGIVGIVSARFLPEYSFDILGKGRLSATGKGAATGAAVGVFDGLVLTGATAIALPPLAEHGLRNGHIQEDHGLLSSIWVGQWLRLFFQSFNPPLIPVKLITFQNVITSVLSLLRSKHKRASS